MSRLATRHGGEQDHGRAFTHGRLELVERSDVLAVDVDVRVLELSLERGEARRQIVEELADGVAAARHLTLAARRRAQCGRNLDSHACALLADVSELPVQNST